MIALAQRQIYLLVGGIGHRQQLGRRARTTHRFIGEQAMSDSDEAQKLDLECLRLASDCMQLATGGLSPPLQAHLRGMAQIWSAMARCELDLASPTRH
jgi:hypothetical protein